MHRQRRRTTPKPLSAQPLPQEPPESPPTLEELNQEALDTGYITPQQVARRLEQAIVSNYKYVLRRRKKERDNLTDLAKAQEMAAMARAIILLRGE